MAQIQTTSFAANFLLSAAILLVAPDFAIAVQIKVLDAQGLPVRGAWVLIGDRQGEPVATNWKAVDSSGTADFPEISQNTYTVTAIAPGFVTRSRLGHDCQHNLTIELASAVRNGEVFVSGSVSNFPPTRRDDKIDLGITIPLLKTNQIYNLRLSDVLSPEPDTIGFFGQRMASSSNITFPNQTERLGIIPVTLDKPTFRWPTEDRGPMGFVTLHGQVPFQKTVNDRRNGSPITDLFNDLQFISAGLSSTDVGASGAVLSARVQDLTFPARVQVQAPVIPSGWTLTVVPLVEVTGGWAPTDIKSLRSQESRSLQMTNPGEPNSLQTRSQVAVAMLSQEQARTAPSGLQFLAGWSLEIPDEASSTTIVPCSPNANLSLPILQTIPNFGSASPMPVDTTDGRSVVLTWTNPAQIAQHYPHATTIRLLALEP